MASLLTLAPGPASADGPPSCNGLPLFGTAEELAATPREFFSLELLALFLGGGFTARQEVYDRVVADVEAAHRMDPRLAGIFFFPPYDGRSLLLSVDDATEAAMVAGTYDAWDCLNDWYGLVDVRPVIPRLVVVELEGVYHLEALLPQYTALPGVSRAEINGFAGDGSTTCLLAQDSIHHYVFDQAGGDCPAGCTEHVLTYVTTESAGAPRFHGRWDSTSAEPAPPWLTLWEVCRGQGRTLPAALPGDVAVFPAAPSTADEILLTLTGPFGSGACERRVEDVTVDPLTGVIRVDAVDNPGCQPCPLAATAPVTELPLGQLAAGDYQVFSWSRDGCSGDETFEASRRFTVRPAADTAASCGRGQQPAATLLVPYFEVDLGRPQGVNTLVTVSNAEPTATLARVVLWTDWGLPSLGFTLELPPLGVRVLDLRALFERGDVPLVDFPPVSVAGAAPDVLPPPGCTSAPALDDVFLAELAARHTGRPSPDDGLCYGARRPGRVARGYVTVDVANRCSLHARFPGDAGYFEAGGQGVAGNRNVLWGDVLYVDPSGDAAQGMNAVAIAADPRPFAEGAVDSFYRGWQDGETSDERLPLGRAYRTRFLSGGGAGMATELLVWTEGTGGLVSPVPCGETPSRPDPRIFLSVHARDQGGQDAGMVFEPTAERTAKLALGMEPLVFDAAFGQLDVEVFSACELCGSPEPPRPLQLWAAPVWTAQGRFSTVLEATRLDAVCP